MMKWKYYNYAMIPATEPHEDVDLEPIMNGKIWKTREGRGIPLLARWTSDFDCGYETQWWYVIKDTSFDISKLKAKRRYEINKGKKNFDVRRIKAADYADELLDVQIAAFNGWPEKYRPTVDAEKFKAGLASWDEKVVYGGFDKDIGILVAYACLTEYEHHIEFAVLRADPHAEKFGINAAMVAAIVEDYNDRLSKDFYICDGARSIRHETSFQDYLEKYFEFRKAYCRLNIRYRFPVGVAVSMLYPIRNWINKDKKLGSLVYSLLQMEEIRRDIS